VMARCLLGAPALSISAIALSLYAVIQSWMTFCAWLGLLVTVAGISCSAVALYQNHQSYGKGDLYPGLRGAWARLKTLRRRPVVHEARVAMDAVAGLDVATPRVDQAISEDMPPAQQVSILAERIRELEQRLTEQHNNDMNSLRRELERLESISAEADHVIEDLAREVGAGTVKLQLWGLLLVGFGTVLLAVPAL